MTQFALYLAEPLGLHDALALGEQAEALGFDLVAACQNFFWWEQGEAPVWDLFTLLNTLANRTSIDLMTNVVDPFARHPATVAHILATFDNLWPGRLTLGLGPGEVMNFGPLKDVAGEPPYRLMTRTQEFIEVMHGIWASTVEAPFSYAGRYFQIADAHLSMKPVTKPHPPIYVAAMGPNMRRLTGRIADGWTPATYTPATYSADWQLIADSAIAAGRDPDQIGRALTIFTCVMTDGAAARARASVFGRLELVARPNLLHQLGYGELADDRFSLANTAGISTGVDRAAQIPQQLGEQVTICGTPHDAIVQIEAFVDAGVERFMIWPLYSQATACKETLTHFQQTILPHFKGQTA